MTILHLQAARGFCRPIQIFMLSDRYETYTIAAEYNGVTISHSNTTDVTQKNSTVTSLAESAAEISGKGIWAGLKWLAARDDETCIPVTVRDPHLPFQFKTCPYRFEA